MIVVEIRRPKIDDLKELNRFFRIVITDTFAKEGLTELLDEIEKEIEDKRKYLNIDFKSNGESRCFFIALYNDQIIVDILSIAQKIWKEKFGEPDYLLEDFWGKGYDHMIWRRRVSEISIMFRI